MERRESEHLRLDPAEDDDDALSYVERLLERNDLPTDDVRSVADSLYVALDDDRRVGIGGVEVYGSAGLLRSVVVEESARDRGYGAAICDALETRARNAGIDRLYLLTTTAAPFFRGRGYREIDRDEAPESLRETTQFADLCPSSATCLTRTL